MRAEGTFAVASFVPATVTPAAHVATAVDVAVATMEKTYAGEVVGRSSTLFTSAFDQARGIRTDVAVESFEGSLGGIRGTCNFAHSATTTGGMALEADGTHRIWFDHSLPSGG
jgi:hypothetical protein